MTATVLLKKRQQDFFRYISTSQMMTRFLKKEAQKKGPEPEDIKLSTINGRTYAYIGLERISGIMMFDVTSPQQSSFINYINSRDFQNEDFSSNIGTDISVEGLEVVAQENSPTGRNLLIAANEVSGDVAVYQVADKNAPIITKGFKQTITKGSLAVFTSNADIRNFQKLIIDNKIVSKDNYTLTEGSTIVTLNAEFTASLTEGIHTISIVSTTGTATTKFTVNPASSVINDTDNPKTGINVPLIIVLSIAFILVCTINTINTIKKSR